MLTREQIREKLLNIPHNGSADFCDVVVEYSLRSYHIIHKDFITEGLTLKDAVRTIFNSQTGQTPTQPPIAQPTKG